MKRTTDLIPYILQALKDDRAPVQLAAMEWINEEYADLTDEWKAEADVLVPTLVKIIEDVDLENPKINLEGMEYYPDEEVAQRCVDILRKYMPPADEVVPALAGLLGRGVRINFQRNIIMFIADYGPDAAAAVPKLAEVLVPEYPHAGLAAFVLGEIGPAAVEAVPALINALSDEDPGVRWNAATALGLIGHYSDVVMFALRKAAETDANGDVRQAAKQAIEKIEERQND
jgi:hypothetical protein